MYSTSKGWVLGYEKGDRDVCEEEGEGGVYV
jgi:hypothetical protein